MWRTIELDPRTHCSPARWTTYGAPSPQERGSAWSRSPQGGGRELATTLALMLVSTPVQQTPLIRDPVYLARSAWVFLHPQILFKHSCSSGIQIGGYAHAGI